ncbi:alpha/beta hydrolase [Subtercola boreus]|nr:alpha/beta hydrolase [Subtercola boreus]TQL54890.1 acetyl esterase/lipase [Subtercola boreus]
MRTVEFAAGLKADIYVPASDARGAGEAGDAGVAREALPVILWLHGGAWRVGDRTLAPDLQRYFADRGFAMVSIDYRLSGDAVFPAQLDDVRTAIRWVKEHAADYSFDPDAIGLWGSSAGGHLAALAAVTADAADIATAVHAVVDGYGAADLLAPDQDVPPTVGLLGGPVQERRDLAIAASPARHVTSSAPPFLILHGGADPLVPASQSVTLFEALAAADVPATLYVIDGFGHGFFNPVGGEELAGPPIDAGHLEADPHANATVRVHPAAPGDAISPPAASFDLIESFFRTHLTRP